MLARGAMGEAHQIGSGCCRRRQLLEFSHLTSITDEFLPEIKRGPNDVDRYCFLLHELLSNYLGIFACRLQTNCLESA
jgi:hypothetical protein